MAAKTVSLDKKIPPFSRPVTGGGNWKLADAAGKQLVLYFYPRDNTTGCTKEGEAFRDLHAQFRKAGAVIIGVSPDSACFSRQIQDQNVVSVRAPGG